MRSPSRPDDAYSSRSTSSFEAEECSLVCFVAVSESEDRLARKRVEPAMPTPTNCEAAGVHGVCGVGAWRRSGDPRCVR